MSVIKIKSNICDYYLHFGKAKEFLPKIDKKFTAYYYIIDANVWELYKDSCLQYLKKPEVIILPISEEQKCLETVLEIYDYLIKRSTKRNMTMISIGGGIIQDITGFAASTLYRGINWIFVPTTLLAQADSCIGSKTSLNYKGFKNLIGTFYPPSEIFIDPNFLATLKDIDFYSGLGEVIKLHIMGGESNIQKIIGLLPKIVARKNEALLTAVYNSLLIKQSYIEEDEFDSGRRNLLNFGHCFGHALETTSNFEIPHGQAVVLGMILANIVARRRGILSDNLESFLLDKLLLPSLKAKLKKEYFNQQAVISAMQKDKKRTGKDLSLIIMEDGYKLVRVNDVDVSEVTQALNNLVPIFNDALGESLRIINIHGN